MLLSGSAEAIVSPAQLKRSAKATPGCHRLDLFFILQDNRLTVDAKWGVHPKGSRTREDYGEFKCLRSAGLVAFWHSGQTV